MLIAVKVLTMKMISVPWKHGTGLARVMALLYNREVAVTRCAKFSQAKCDRIRELWCFTGSKLGWMMPLLGDAFFTSAISPGLPVRSHASFNAPMKLRGGGAFFTIVITMFSGSSSLRWKEKPGQKTSLTTKEG